jgi:hypothetical protein
MPHIVKYAEKIKCVKSNLNTLWQEDLARKYVRTCETKTDLFSLIEEIIDNTLPKASSEFFNQFVDIKEVPYGRYNSDSDYRGS